VLARYLPQATQQRRAWAEEAAVSHLYGGIHFRSDNVAGLELGKKVATAAIAEYDPARSPR
jgi:hypothetical protein